MNTKMPLASLASLCAIALSACMGDQSSLEAGDDPRTGEAVSAVECTGCTEHVLNGELTLPPTRDQTAFQTFQVPTFYKDAAGPFPLSLSNQVLYWHGWHNTSDPSRLSSYVRFVTDAPTAPSAALLSISPGVTAGLVQAFASYPGGSPVTRPSRISARVMVLSGDVKLELSSVHGSAQCRVESNASTPRGVWVTLSADCPAPPSSDPYNMVTLYSASGTGVIAMVDRISVRD